MRLIDADDLGVGRCSKDVLPAAYCAGWNGLLGLIEKAPTVDAVPIVRCMDFKHFRVYIGRDMCAKNAKLLGGREVGLCATGKDDFCNYGERKKTMNDKIPYAGMLEDGIQKLTEGKAQNAVLCGLLEDGTTCVAYANASPEDLANIACHLLSEAFMRTVLVNIDMVKDALDEYEDEEGEAE